MLHAYICFFIGKKETCQGYSIIFPSDTKALQQCWVLHIYFIVVVNVTVFVTVKYLHAAFLKRSSFSVCVSFNTCSLCGADPHGPVRLSVTSLSKPFSVRPSFHQWRFIPALFSLSFLLLFFLSFYVCFFLPLILLFLFGGTEPSSGRSSPLSSRPATPTLSLTPKHFHVPGRSWSIISLFFFSREFFCSVSLPPFVHSNPLYNAFMVFRIYCFDGRFCFPLMLRLSQIIQKFWSSCIYIAFPQIMIITDTICNLGGIKHVLLKLDLYFLIHRPRH